MTLDEKAINAVKEYFEAIAQNALDAAYASMDEDISYAEFMENLVEKLNQLSSEHVAAEILHLSSKAIGEYNSGGGMYVDDVQELIDSDDDEEEDLDEDEEL